jgi:hypothetical protein
MGSTSPPLRRAGGVREELDPRADEGGSGCSASAREEGWPPEGPGRGATDVGGGPVRAAEAHGGRDLPDAGDLEADAVRLRAGEACVRQGGQGEHRHGRARSRDQDNRLSQEDIYIEEV